MQRIPVIRDNPAYTYAIALDGLSFRFTFTFNGRSNDWHLDIAEENGTVIVSGIRLVVNWNLLGRKQDDRLPPGMLMLMSLDPDDNSAPALAELGRRCSLVYYTEDDLDAIDTTPLPAVPGSWTDIFGASGPVVT